MTSLAAKLISLPMNLRLILFDQEFAICRLNPSEEMPPWSMQSEQPFYAIARSEHELSITCLAKNVPPGTICDMGWRALAVEGPLAFSQTGILVSIIEPLASAEISIFTISTYDTDYILVKNVEAALEILTGRFTIISNGSEFIK